jgi:diguanylate cyclase (GGDEF)-like protein
MFLDFLSRFLLVSSRPDAIRKTLLISLVVAYTAVFATEHFLRTYVPVLWEYAGQAPTRIAFFIAFVLSIGFVAAFMAVALKLNSATARLAELARNDSLTGLLNRRAFFQEVDLRERGRNRGKRQNWLMLIDADHFKAINDNYGHAAGDLVLTMIAMVLKGNVFERDLIARIGGEEFAVYLENSNSEGIAKAAERIRSAIEENTVYFESKRIKVTVSIGYSSFNMGEDGAQVMARADRSLYEAKNTGRNRIVFSQSTEHLQPLPVTGGDGTADQKPAIRLVSTN